MSTPLTLIGLGPMGQAMVAKYLEHGHPVTVWNRTASRADDLVARGAVRADTPRDAVAANRLVVLSLTDYQAMYDVLGDAELAGKTVVNLSSDTPDKTLKAAAWLAERGAELVVGGVMVPAPLVGEEAAYVFYSGPKAVFEQHAEVLAVIGRTEYLGEDHALAQLFYQAQLDFFLTTLAATLHSVALVRTAGVTAAQFAPYLKDNAESIWMYLEETITAVDRGEHPGDLANIVMMGATADHVVGASEATGVDAGLPRAVQDMYRRAIEAGHGQESWTALYEVIKPAK
ncbi:NAD(P)-binding domain-containing protein [Actinosynnema sp. NPDC047251]|uniref:6-phosphogluconate dehydrogenase n=1 Tax=Saccharothrix espanaensis (strain ATCC 51144 / DSM 44229 / JCM 9112 / NBRC 15066 / NRRL 15764) TaxID=1179773 RepID=K0K4C6_SACES|nr:NAD(P)-binding domain-containing protein [Saccharothrix espanaensis]CCH35085.1 6-phosphogluconate dehydrogenase [Saccharothrix espanaensis DSM 44229]